ncbi:MAG: hypothetical protein AAF558_09410, partial [Verrucomicrobiota bacterium]
VAAVVAYAANTHGDWGYSSPEEKLILAAFILPLVAIIILWSIAAFAIRALVIPRLYVRGGNIRSTVKDSWELFCTYPWEWLKFMFFFIPLNIAVVFIIVFSCLITCCLAILPYIHHVVMLPLYVFLQAYFLCFLAQFGSGWNAFETTDPSAPPLPDSPSNA